MIDTTQFWSKYNSCEVYDIIELPDEIQESIELAKKESEKAYAPYSNYSVGAVIVTNTGKQISSANAETCNYDVVCAEAGAISEWAKTRYKNAGKTHIDSESISYIITFGKPYVSGDSLRSDVFVTPCGRCRQRLYEHCGDNTLIISCNETCNKVRVFKLCDLLPFAFSPKNLK